MLLLISIATGQLRARGKDFEGTWCLLSHSSREELVPDCKPVLHLAGSVFSTCVWLSEHPELCWWSSLFSSAVQGRASAVPCSTTTTAGLGDVRSAPGQGMSPPVLPSISLWYN